MASLVLTGDTSGQVTIAAPAVAGTNTLTLLAATATNSVNKLSTAVASTSGTAIDFTDIPAWVERITVMFQNVSLSLNESYLVQLGTGSTTYTTSGYTATSILGTTGGNTLNTSTAGLIMGASLASGFASGHMVITNITGNSWVSSSVLKRGTDGVQMSSGDVSLGAVLTAVRITSNGTSTFDSGTINLLVEG
jgi:hypothetical protein